MLTFQETSAEQMPQLFEILFDYLPDEEKKLRVAQMLGQYQQESAKNNNRQNHILHFERNGRVVGGFLSMMRPDGTLLALMPAIAENEPRQTLYALYTKLLKRCHILNARLCMLLGDCQQPINNDLLKVFEFQKVSELLNLCVERMYFPERSPAHRVTFVSYTENRWDAMVSLVTRTYEQTLDFPMLTGLVPASTVLQGYQESHPFDPSLWFFLQSEGQTIGALLLTKIKNSDYLELTYLGLVPEFRGKRLAREIIDYAQYVAYQRDCQNLLVSVDVANTPALAAYLHAQFRMYDQKTIFVRFF